MPVNLPEQNLAPWVCIARAGTFRDSAGREHTFRDSDLDAIAAAYDPAKSEAPLVLGHPKDNAPACGWIKSVRSDGQRLYAQFAHLFSRVVQVVQEVEHGFYLDENKICRCSVS